MTEQPSSRGTWWDELDDELAAAGAELAPEQPDPWGTGGPEAPELTPDQHAFLEGLADQPAVPRLSGLSSEPDEPGDPRAATGSPPGDTAGGDS